MMYRSVSHSFNLTLWTRLFRREGFDTEEMSDTCETIRGAREAVESCYNGLACDRCHQFIGEVLVSVRNRV